MDSNQNHMKTITKLIISAVLMCTVLPASARKSEVLKVMEQYRDKAGALYQTVNTEDMQISTDNLKVNGADMHINIGDARIPAGVETINIMMYMGENEAENSRLNKQMNNALKNYEVLMEIKFQGMDAKLYSKNIDEEHLSELVLYCPSLMNGVILFEGRISAEDIAQELLGEGKIRFN